MAKKQVSTKKRKKIRRSVKKTSSKRKTTSRKKVKKVIRKKAKVETEGQFVGKVTHYFPHVQAAVVELKKGNLKIGDSILIKGHTTYLKQTINSMQIDRASITEAKKGDEIGLQVTERVREHDKVFKLN